MKKSFSLFLALLLIMCSFTQVVFAGSETSDDKQLEEFIQELEESGVPQEEIELLRQSEINPEPAFTEETNEYVLYKELKEKSKEDLEALGLSEESIADLKDLDYAEELIKRSKLDDNELKSMGYTKKQIKMLRNFKGTESEIIALAATRNMRYSL